MSSETEVAPPSPTNPEPESNAEVSAMPTPAATSEKSPLLTLLKEATFFAAIYLYFAGFVYIYYYYEHFGISLNAIEIPIYHFFVYSYNVLTSLAWSEVWAHALRSQWVVILIFALLTVGGMTAFPKWKLRVLIFGFLVLLFPLTFSFAWKAADLYANDVRNGNYVKTITLAFKDDAMKIFPQKVIAAGGATRESAKKPSAPNGQPPPAAPQPTPELPSLPRLVSANSQQFLKPGDDKCPPYQGEKTTTGPHQGEETPKGPPALWLLAETKDHYYVLYQPWKCPGQSPPSGFVYEISKADVTFAEVTVR